MPNSESIDLMLRNPPNIVKAIPIDDIGSEVSELRTWLWCEGMLNWYGQCYSREHHGFYFERYNKTSMRSFETDRTPPNLSNPRTLDVLLKHIQNMCPPHSKPNMLCSKNSNSYGNMSYIASYAVYDLGDEDTFKGTPWAPSKAQAALIAMKHLEETVPMRVLAGRILTIADENNQLPSIYNEAYAKEVLQKYVDTEDTGEENAET